MLKSFGLKYQGSISKLRGRNHGLGKVFQGRYDLDERS